MNILGREPIVAGCGLGVGASSGADRGVRRHVEYLGHACADELEQVDNAIRAAFEA